MIHEEKMKRLAESIQKAASDIESYFLEETGHIRYRSISEEEEYYEIEGDTAGLVHYGIEILKSSIANGSPNENGQGIKIELSISQLFDSKTEVLPVSISRTDRFDLYDVKDLVPASFKVKAISFAVLFGILAFIGFGIFGIIEFIKWIL